MIASQPPKPDIIIVDDNLNFRQGLIFLITIDNVANVIGKAANEEEFLKLLAHLKPDVVLIDVNMLQKKGMEALVRALELIPDLKIIAFTMFGDEEYYFKMNKLGVKGFLLKSGGINELEKAIENVMKGETYVSDQLLKKIILSFTRSNAFNYIENAGLTPIESQVMELVCQGLTNEAIAQKLSVNSHEVKDHKLRLLKKISSIYTPQVALAEPDYILK